MSVGQITATAVPSSSPNDWGSTDTWDIGVVPSNDFFGNSYDVVIDGDDSVASEITILNDQAFVVDSLTIKPGDQLTLRNGFSDSPKLTISPSSRSGELLNQGRIVLDNTQFKSFTNSNDTTLELDGDTDIAGGGNISLQESVLKFTNQFGLPPTVRNVDNAISGSGTIDPAAGSFTNGNLGQVEANAAGKTLELRHASFDSYINDGQFRASSGGILSLSDVVQQNGGSIEAADGSTVQIRAGSRLTGGSLLATGTGEFDIEFPFNTGARPTQFSNISLDASLELPDRATLLITGPIENLQSIRLKGSSDRVASELFVEGSATLTGGGTLELAGGNAGFLLSGFLSPGTLTNVDNSIQGHGSITSSFINGEAGLVNANLPGRTLAIDIDTGRPSDGPYENAGTLRASNGGTLVVNSWFGQELINTGIIEALDESLVNVRTAVVGGNLRTEGSGKIGISGGALRDVSLDGQFVAVQGSRVQISGNIQNLGDVLLDEERSFFGGTQTFLPTDTTLTGGGTITQHQNESHISNETFRRSLGDVVLRNIDNTIQGQGGIGSNSMQIINEAAGTIDATGFGSLRLVASLDDNAPLINRGVLRASGGGNLRLNGTLDSFDIPFSVSANIQNEGGLIESVGFRAGESDPFEPDADTDFGSIVDLSNTTITGGILRTSNKGRFGLGGDSSLATTVIRDADVGGIFELNRAARLSLTGDFRLERPLTFIGNDGDTFGPIDEQRQVVSDRNLVLDEQLTVTLKGSVSLTDAELETNGGLRNVNSRIVGSGRIEFLANEFVNEAGGLIDANEADSRNAANPFAERDTLSLAGSSDPAILFVNRGVLQASNGGWLTIAEGQLDNAGGRIEALDGSQLTIGFESAITGGELATAGSGAIEIAAALSPISTIAVLQDVSLDGRIQMEWRADVNLAGRITNRQQFNASSRNRVKISEDTILTGGGTIQLGDPTQLDSSFSRSDIDAANTAVSPEQTPELRNVDNTIQGYGRIGASGLKLINEVAGVIDANQANQTLVIVPRRTGGITNFGTLRASNGGTLSMAGPLSNAGTTDADFTNNGVIDVHDRSLFAGPGTLANDTDGTLQGTGTIDYANVLNLGTIAPGASPGTLSIVGDLELTETSVLDLEIAGTLDGEFDVLAVDGNVTLGGTLAVEFTDYTPGLNDQFSVMTAASFSGWFDNRSTGEAFLSADGRYRFDVSVDDRPLSFQRIVLSNVRAIPEPSSILVMGLFALTATTIRRRCS